MLNIEMLAAAWNPADAMSVQGRYPTPQNNARVAPSNNNVPNDTTEDTNDTTDIDNTTWAASVATLTSTSTITPRSVAGSEGWGRVVEIVDVGNTDSDGYDHYDDATATLATNRTAAVVVGDYVVPSRAGLGLCRSSLWLPESAVVRLDRGAELVAAVGPWAAAPLFQTGGTALRMLTDFAAPLSSDGYIEAENGLQQQQQRRGDIVLQNAGNSAVGFMVSQLAASMGLHPVSFVRQEKDRVWTQVVDHLTLQGKNTIVLPDTNSNNPSSKADIELIQSLLRTVSDRPPRLALNAVGGRSATTLLNLLGSNGTLVTYGGMSKEPVTVPTSHLIFRNVHIVGYWHSQWMAQASLTFTSSTPSLLLAHRQRQQCMMNELVDGVLNGSLQCPPIQAFPLSRFREAFAFETQQTNETVRRKVVFDCQESNERTSKLRAEQADTGCSNKLTLNSS